MSDFFGKLKDGLNKGVATASVRSKELLEINKVKSQIDTLDKQKRECLEELGNIVFTMVSRNDLNEILVREKCEYIQRLVISIAEKNQELLEIKANADTALGKPKPIALCQCGAELYETTKFCGSCGTPVMVTNDHAEGVSQ